MTYTHHLHLSPIESIKHTLRFLWTTLIAGLLFLAPILLTVILLREAIRLLGKILNPVASHLPLHPAFGIGVRELAAIILLVALILIGGLISRTATASRLSLKLERLVLRKLPGYTLFKTVAHGAAGAAAASDLKVALANIDDAWLLAFIVEDSPDGGLHTIFIPSAPTPTAGSIYYLREDQIQRLNVPVASAVQCIMQLGVGSHDLLNPSSPSPTTVSSPMERAPSSFTPPPIISPLPPQPR